MGSFNESLNSIMYKSSLELKAFQFCDYNEKIKKFSIEPFAIQYVKPTDNKLHRYYPDLFIEFDEKNRFLVEVKSFSETQLPIKPKKITTKSTKNYKKALVTYSINQAKWSAAKDFCDKKGIRFIFLTEKELH